MLGGDFSTFTPLHARYTLYTLYILYTLYTLYTHNLYLSGSQLAMKGRGVPLINSSGVSTRKGDQIVHLNVTMPTHLTHQQRQVLENFHDLDTLFGGKDTSSTTDSISSSGSDGSGSTYKSVGEDWKEDKKAASSSSSSSRPTGDSSSDSSHSSLWDKLKGYVAGG